MSVKLTALGTNEASNPRTLLFKGKLSGNYGVNGVGDLINLKPSQNGGADGGITDPNFLYNAPIVTPPLSMRVVNDNIGGSYCAINPNAAPSLTNFGLLVYEPGGAEKATNAAYTAAELAGDITVEVTLGQQ